MPARPPHPAQDALFPFDGVGGLFGAFEDPSDVALAAQFEQVPADWQDLTDAFLRGPAGQQVLTRMASVRAQGVPVYPEDVFAALKFTRRQDVRVVILGQDPYHGPGQAHGLAFSVQRGVPIPPSLRNVRAELQRDLGLRLPGHGNLEAWAHQGVLLLNTVLTVSMGQAASHAGWGWELLTDNLIAQVAASAPPCVFMLWGAHAQRKLPLIESAAQRRGPADAHLILQANHPSPLSATRGPTPFIGCGHFGLAQDFWAQRGQTLDWSLPA